MSKWHVLSDIRFLFFIMLVLLVGLYFIYPITKDSNYSNIGLFSLIGSNNANVNISADGNNDTDLNVPIRGNIFNTNPE